MIDPKHRNVRLHLRGEMQDHGFVRAEIRGDDGAAIGLRDGPRHDFERRTCRAVRRWLWRFDRRSWAKSEAFGIVYGITRNADASTNVAPRQAVFSRYDTGIPPARCVSRLVKALTNLIDVARREGTQQALASLRHRASERFHEWRFGVETEGGATPEQLGFTNPACRLYEATDYATLFRVLGGLKWQEGRELFIDFGCGKGRVLLVAAMQPVRRVIGVELSSTLSTIARKNIHRAQRRLRCRDVEVVTCSADAFVIPPSPLTIFFWNPFAGEILERVLENIHASYRKHPRPIRVIAAYPPGSEFEQRIAAQAWLEVRETGLLRDDVAYRLTEVVGE